MNELTSGRYGSKYGKGLLAYLASLIRQLGPDANKNVTCSEIKKNVMAYYISNQKDKNDENDYKQKQKEEIENLIELIFGSEKKYKGCFYGFLGFLLLAVIFLIVICNKFNLCLLIMFLIASVASGILLKCLWGKREFNIEKERLEKLGSNFDNKALYTQGPVQMNVDLDLPSQDQMEGYYPNNNNNLINNQHHVPNMIQPGQQSDVNIINTNSIPYQ